MSTTLTGVIIGVIVVAIVAVVFFWYQFWRVRESFKHIDYSKLRNWDNDDWSG